MEGVDYLKKLTYGRGKGQIDDQRQPKFPFTYARMTAGEAKKLEKEHSQKMAKMKELLE